MKIEKINDRQIRCTLTKEDLLQRNINLGEFAYGSDKAKELFADMMRIAMRDFGFDVSNTALVVEAIPMSAESLMLIVTKVDDPEELDPRFSRFSPEEGEDHFTMEDLKNQIEGADDVIALVQKLLELKKTITEKTNAAKEEAEKALEKTEVEDADMPNLTRAYCFQTIEALVRVAVVLDNLYEGPNSLYKDPFDGLYYLMVKKGTYPARDFNRICNILSEYGGTCRHTLALDSYFKEHMEVILGQGALQYLRTLA